MKTNENHAVATLVERHRELCCDIVIADTRAQELQKAITVARGKRDDVLRALQALGADTSQLDEVV